MAQKTYHIENLCCPNCAAKIEAKINTLPEVEEAVIVFPTQQLRIRADAPDALLPRLQQIVSAVEPDARITEEHHEHAHHQCSCDHCHQAHDAHHHDAHHHDRHEHMQTHPRQVWLGAGLFALGLILHWLLLDVPALLFFISAYLILGMPVLEKAWKNLRKGHILDENSLMSLATLGAFAIREFPEAVGVMLFYRIGQYFEEKAVARSRSQIMDAVDLRPQTVTLANGQVIPAAHAQVGDLLLIRPGDRIGLDGTVVSGESRIDTAPITGEPVPVAVAPGDALLSGCINLSGALSLQVTKPLSQSMVTRILHAVENAAARKPKIDRFITRFARIYTPTVVAIAALTALIPPLFDGDWNAWIYTALSFLVMSCPCALVLSVPLTFFSGIGVGSKKGILFKGGTSIEALAQVGGIALDKTGTLTQGDFRVQHADPQVLALAAACEQYSTHPIAASILAMAKEQDLILSTPATVQEIPGHGIRAELDGKTVLCGNTKLLDRFGVGYPDQESPAGTAVLVAVDGVYVGNLLIADTLKPDAQQTVACLHAMGLKTALLTGDSEKAANALAETVGIRQVFSRLLPEEKLQTLQTLRKQWGAAMFVGDGINDAPVLAGADVGAAMGDGSEAAIEASDVVFLTRDVQAIADAVQIARRTKQTALQNVIFALVIKAAVMVLGLLGIASMWLAVFADSGVAMLCVLNAVRQLYRK